MWQDRAQAVTGPEDQEVVGNSTGFYYQLNINYRKLINPTFLTKQKMTTTITAADINKLRQQTGAGMMDCRTALTESNGDFEAAIDYLRKKGQKVAALRGDREAKEGVVIAQTSADNKTGYIINLSCETDFVSKNATKCPASAASLPRNAPPARPLCHEMPRQRGLFALYGGKPQYILQCGDIALPGKHGTRGICAHATFVLQRPCSIPG